MKVLLVEHHHLFRKSLRMLLELNDSIRIVGEAGNGKEALDLVEEVMPDVAVIDISLPGRSALEIARQVKRAYSSIKIVILSRFEHNIYVDYAFRCGASAYVLKDCVSDELLMALEDVMTGRRYVSASRAQPLNA